MLCVSTTPGTRSAAAATRSLGASRAGGRLDVHRHLGGPDRGAHRLLDPVHGLVAALQPLQPGHADHHVGEALAARLAHPHRRAPRHARHPAHGLLDLAGRARSARGPSAHRRCATASRTAATSTSAATNSAATASPPGYAGGHQHQADQHRGGAGEVGGEVPRAGDQRRVSLAAAGSRSETAARPASTTSTPPISTKAYQVRLDVAAAGAQPHHGLDSRSRARRPPGTAPPTAPPGAGPCRGRTGVLRRAAARRRPPRTAESSAAAASRPE